MAELEEALIRADMGAAQAQRLAAAVAKGRYDAEISDAELRAVLAREIAAVLAPVQKPLAIDDGKKPFVILVAGVNGTGKTTTIGKLAAPSGRGRPQSDAGGGRYVPRRRHRAVERLGRARRRGICRQQAGRRRGGAGLRGAGESAAPMTADVLLIDTAGRLAEQGRA